MRSFLFLAARTALLLFALFACLCFFTSTARAQCQSCGQSAQSFSAGQCQSQHRTGPVRQLFQNIRDRRAERFSHSYQSCGNPATAAPAVYGYGPTVKSNGPCLNCTECQKNGCTCHGGGNDCCDGQCPIKPGAIADMIPVEKECWLVDGKYIYLPKGVKPPAPKVTETMLWQSGPGLLPSTPTTFGPVTFPQGQFQSCPGGNCPAPQQQRRIFR